MRFGSPQKRKKPSRNWPTGLGCGLGRAGYRRLLPISGDWFHLLSTDGFWMDFPPRRINSVVRFLQGQREAL